MELEFHIVGVISLAVRGLAPREGLVNILGDNWPNAPLRVNHVSYVYTGGVGSAQALAEAYGATLRLEYVRVDNYQEVTSFSLYVVFL